MLKVDYTKAASAVGGPEVKKDAAESKIDLSAIFLPRQPAMPDSEVLFVAFGGQSLEICLVYIKITCEQTRIGITAISSIVPFIHKLYKLENGLKL